MDGRYERWAEAALRAARTCSGPERPLAAHDQNLKRVSPPGSTPSTTVAELGSMRYTCHGGGPCAGALNGAVTPVPLVSGSAGHPPSAHRWAARVTSAGSVTRAAWPSTTTSASRTDTAIEQRGSRSTLRCFFVPAPVWNQNVPSSQSAPTAVTCGLPSSFSVVSHVVLALLASGAGGEPSAIRSTIALQSTGGRPSPLPRLMISMRLLSSCLDEDVSIISSHRGGRRVQRQVGVR